MVSVLTLRGLSAIFSPSLQVMEWTQQALAAGEAFVGGEESSGLRALLQRQSGNFFQAYHTSNVEVRGPRGAVPSVAVGFRNAGALGGFPA